MKKTKKSRLSKTEKYIIQGMLSDNKSIEKISEEIDRPVSVISKYVDNKRTSEDVQEIVTDETPGIKTIDLMTSPNSPKGQRPVIMTKSASERGEHYAKNAGGFTKRHDKCIFDTEGKSLTDE